jgi:hypothetical protein
VWPVACAIQQRLGRIRFHVGGRPVSDGTLNISKQASHRLVSRKALPPALYDPARHERLTSTSWSDTAAADAILRIAEDAAARFHADALWPTHPMDEPRDADPYCMLYFGAAGVIYALRRLAAAGIRFTLRATALRDAGLANWPDRLPLPEEGPATTRVQDCHGAPGIVCRLPNHAVPALDDLLLEAGELVWQAGPLVKGAGLCHGTAGNGYMFLKLYRRSGDTRWLERARAFAMHALEQCDRAAATYGQRRYSLWTGDPGVALFLQGCRLPATLMVLFAR